MIPCVIIQTECGCDCGKKQLELTKAFYGRSEHRWLNLLISPLALLFHFLYAYVYNCVYIYVSRLFNHACCLFCVHHNSFKACYVFTDKNFPPNSASINAEVENLEWIRASELIHNPVLFKDGTEPKDIVQGNLANCWLMSAITCLAEFPGLVDSVFVTRERSYRGKYQVTLFDGFANKWRLITVDDYLPTIKTPGNAFEVNKPLYAQPQSKEIWVAILEKAFAKFRGSYEALNGGNALWALRCLTGDFVFRLSKKENEEDTTKIMWQKLDLIEHDPKDKSPFAVTVSGQEFSSYDLFDLLRTYDQSKALVTAAAQLKEKSESEKSYCGEEVDEETGLVRGHSYALLQVKRIRDGAQEFCLIQLRNPWAEFEWKGDWSDSSPLWKKWATVAQKVKFKPGEDGLFWMELADFQKFFSNIDICDRTVGYNEFSLNVHEVSFTGHKNMWKQVLRKQVGPLRGCLEGLGRFLCLCEGARALYCGNDSKTSVKKIVDKGGRDDTLFSDIV